MVKIREAKYCNLKLFLIYLVVYGHMIETVTHYNAFAMIIYRVIYAFHMPAFVLLSGMFSQKCSLKQAKKLMLRYILLQMSAVLLGKAKLMTPYWHLWYLLSYALWSALGYFFTHFPKGKWLILGLSVTAGCAVGYVSWIGREFSLSRTIVFFPYYWLGVCLRTNTNWKKLRLPALIGTVFAIMLLLTFNISIQFLYQATAYSDLQNGALLRLLCYAIGGVMSLSLLSMMPDRRFNFSKAGADTFFIYIFHAPLVLLLRKYCLSAWSCLTICAAMMYGFYKIQQCGRNFCGIAEERGRTWQPFKRSMKNMPDRYTDSCSP